MELLADASDLSAAMKALTALMSSTIVTIVLEKSNIRDIILRTRTAFRKINVSE